MKKLCVISIFSTLLIIMFNTSNLNAFENNFGDKNKIAIVDISSIFQELVKTTETVKQLENTLKNRAIDLQKEENDLQNKINDLQRDASTMKVSERIKIEKKLLKQRAEFASKAQIFEQDNRRLHIAEHNKILKKIHNIIQNIAVNKGYNMVIDTNAIAFSTQIKDITSDVLKQVQ